MTSLVLYGTANAATTVTTANALLANPSTGGSTINKNTTVGTSTGYGEVISQGTGVAWAAGGSIGSPSGKGWLFDATTLEGQQILSGNWTPIVRMKWSVGTATADIHIRAYVRSSGGVYTQIGSDMVLSAQSFTTTVTAYTFAATSLPVQNFNTGDKLYIDCWLNITTNGSGSGAAIVQMIQSTSTTLGAANCVQITTPGYATLSVRDIATRFSLKSADQLKDIATRFILAAGNTQSIRDIATRFRLKSADQLKDISTRFRLMSANQLKDIATRFRLMSANQLKDISTRFILASASQRLKDISSRFRLRSADQLKDIALRFRLMSANKLKDVSSRFRLRSANQQRDILSRFILATTIPSSGVTTTIAYGRDGKVIAAARDSVTKATGRDGLITARGR